MPLSITATYNSINKDTAFENGPASGYGWQFSFNQYVREVTDKTLPKQATTISIPMLTVQTITLNFQRVKPLNGKMKTV